MCISVRILLQQRRFTKGFKRKSPKPPVLNPPFLEKSMVGSFAYHMVICRSPIKSAQVLHSMESYQREKSMLFCIWDYKGNRWTIITASVCHHQRPALQIYLRLLSHLHFPDPCWFRHPCTESKTGYPCERI